MLPDCECYIIHVILWIVLPLCKCKLIEWSSNWSFNISQDVNYCCVIRKKGLECWAFDDTSSIVCKHFTAVEVCNIQSTVLSCRLKVTCTELCGRGSSNMYWFLCCRLYYVIIVIDWEMLAVCAFVFVHMALNN